jgi:hypothetical protein
MQTQESLDVGVIVERRKIDHPWQEWEWRPVAVFIGAEPQCNWTEISRGDGWTHYHAATLPIELHRRETEAYVHNLETGTPSVYIVMREDEDGETSRPYYIELVTASPYDAQDYLDSGEEIVERVPMPEPVLAWVDHFISQHHVEEKFIKRRRDKLKIEDHKFGQEPLVELRRRMAQPMEDGSDG